MCAYNDRMRAMTISNGKLVEAEVPRPSPGAGEVLIEVAAAGINPADLLQVQGNYPPPAGAPDWPGLEVSGRVTQTGDGVDPGLVGARVAALLDGGGYAEYCVARAADLWVLEGGAGQADVIAAAGLPEAVATMYSNLVFEAGLDPRDNAGKSVLVHGGSGGVGSSAIQWLHATGATVFTTAGGAERVTRCEELGAEGIDYRTEDFTERVRELTGGRGVDVVLDIIGGAYLQRNLEALAEHGRLVIIGMQKGKRGELDINLLMRRWLSVRGTVLRARPPEQKAEIMAGVRSHVVPLIEEGRVRPLVHERLPLSEAAAAQELLAGGGVFGKVLLVP